jgi:hypothetical protein
MQLIKGLLNYSEPWESSHIYLFTGNAMIKNNGAIVMGRGAAKQVRDTYPGIDKAYGAELQRHPDAHIMWVSRMGLTGNQALGWFKVKHHWANNAEPSLITESTQKLKEHALSKPDLVYHMNFPGVGNGGLNEADVLNLIEPLPHNVLIYR